ncbi:hypothetical protein HDU98_003404, partial [Podochytrium sp. JEL0797]
MVGDKAEIVISEVLVPSSRLSADPNKTESLGNLSKSSLPFTISVNPAVLTARSPLEKDSLQPMPSREPNPRAAPTADPVFINKEESIDAVDEEGLVLVRHEEAKAGLKEVFEELGLDFEEQLQYHRKAILKCIPTAIPKGSILLKLVRDVFELFGPRKCPRSGAPFFSKTG